MKLCMVGGLRCVVILVKCDPNRSRGYGAVGGRKWPFPITLATGLYNSLYYRTSRDNRVRCFLKRTGYMQDRPARCQFWLFAEQCKSIADQRK